MSTKEDCSTEDHVLQTLCSRKRKNRDRCAYCGVHRENEPDRSYFRFPKDPERCIAWVSACGRPYLKEKTVQQLSTCFRLCSLHFQADDYTTAMMNKLHSSAVPTKFDFCDTHVKQPKLDLSILQNSLREKLSASAHEQAGQSSEYQGETSNSRHLEEPPPVPVSKVATKVLSPKTKRIKVLSSKVYYLKKKLSNTFSGCGNKIKVNQVLTIIKSLVPLPLFTFISSQLKGSSVSRYGRRWTLEDKNLALQLYLASPKAYRTLSNVFILPSSRTLTSCLQSLKLEPGFSDTVLHAIKYVSRRFKKHDKYCVISFDEMKLKPALSYNSEKDSITGYENYGCYSKPSSKIATHALVFMVRGLCKKWKQVFGYFFSCNAAPAYILKELVFSAVRKITDSGLNPLAIVCDMGSCNQSLYETELQITPEQPFFLFEDKKIYAFCDAPHLLKCFRNNFKKYPLTFNGGKTAYWTHIQSAYDFDSRMPHKIAPKLTTRHLTVGGFSNMNVRLAAQIFSLSVSTLLSYLSVLGPLPSSAVNTSELCSTVNDLFDSFNSRYFLHKTRPLLCAVSEASEHFEFWKKSVDFIKSIQFQTSKIVRFPFLQGWLITLSAALELVPILMKQIKFVMMCRFTQDALENTFSQLRLKGGHNDHPTPAMFSSRIRMFMAEGIISVCGKGNCERDNDTTLLPVELICASNSAPTPAEASVPELSADEILFLDKDLHAENSAANVAGYIAKKVLKLYDCSTCRADLTSEKTLRESTILLTLKEYDKVKDGLCFPSDAFTRTVAVFGCEFLKIFEEKSSCKFIKNEISKHLSSVQHEWLSCSIHTPSIWYAIVNFYTKVMIYYKVKQISRNLPGLERKKTNKSKKLC